MPRRSLRDPGAIASIAAVLIVAGAVAALALAGRMPDVRSVVPLGPSPSATVVAAPITSVSPAPPAPTVAGDEAIGTAVPVATSAVVPPAPAPATPTPTPDPNVWRFEGRVVTDTGQPLQEVCIVIGPHGCRPFGPHTDDQGRYYIDFPQKTDVEYELRFEKEGYGTVYYRVTPTGPTRFDVVLRPS